MNPGIQTLNPSGKENFINCLTDVDLVKETNMNEEIVTSRPNRADHSEAHNSTPSRRTLWVGRLLSDLAVAFLALDASMKLLKLAPAVEGSNQLGYPTSSLLPIGIIQLVCLTAYVIPRTAVIGAVLWTGYLGGAIATHVRVGSPLFSHILFPIYVAALLWAGLRLRDRRVDALFAKSSSFNPRGCSSDNP